MADVIENYLTKENVFEVLQACKENAAEKAVDVCVQFVDEHFNKEEMVQSWRIKKFPEIAAKFIEHDHHSIISVPDRVQRLILSKLEKTSGSITFSVDKAINITGIGLMLSSYANVIVKSSFYQHGEFSGSFKKQLETQEVRTKNESYQRIMFENPKLCDSSKTYCIDIDLTGSGAVYRTELQQSFFEDIGGVLLILDPGSCGYFWENDRPIYMAFYH